jgi:hypothetical protein
MWIRCPGAYEAIVPSSELERARKKLQTNSCARKSQEVLLDELRDLLQRKGRLDKTTINEDLRTSCVATFVKRFGSLYHAYNQIGYLSSYRQTYHESTIQGKKLHSGLCNEFEVRCKELGATVERRAGTNVFVVDRQPSVLVAISHCRLFKQRPCWRFCINQSAERTDFTIVARLSVNNSSILYYYVLPSLELPGRQLQLRQDPTVRYGSYRFDMLDFFIRLVSQGEPVRAEIQDAVAKVSGYHRQTQRAIINRAPAIRGRLASFSKTFHQLLGDCAWVALLRSEGLERIADKLTALKKGPNTTRLRTGCSDADSHVQVRGVNHFESYRFRVFSQQPRAGDPETKNIDE